SSSTPRVIESYGLGGCNLAGTRKESANAAVANVDQLELGTRNILAGLDAHAKPPRLDGHRVWNRHLEFDPVGRPIDNDNTPHDLGCGSLRHGRVASRARRIDARSCDGGGGRDVGIPRAACVDRHRTRLVSSLWLPAAAEHHDERRRKLRSTPTH